MKTTVKNGNRTKQRYPAWLQVNPLLQLQKKAPLQVTVHPVWLKRINFQQIKIQLCINLAYKKSTYKTQRDVFLEVKRVKRAQRKLFHQKCLLPSKHAHSILPCGMIPFEIACTLRLVTAAPSIQKGRVAIYLLMGKDLNGKSFITLHAFCQSE